VRRNPAAFFSTQFKALLGESPSAYQHTHLPGRDLIKPRPPVDRRPSDLHPPDLLHGQTAVDHDDLPCDVARGG
jgi:hypothetical protein